MNKHTLDQEFEFTAAIDGTMTSINFYTPGGEVVGFPVPQLTKVEAGMRYKASIRESKAYIEPAPRSLVELVTDMRNAQRAYFKARKDDDKDRAGAYLTQSKNLEKQVDDMLEALKQPQQQQQLF